MTTQNPRAAVGGNNPPSTEEIMREKHAPIFERLVTWKKSAKRLINFVPETLDDCAKLEKIYREGADLANDADGIRAKEKEPHLRAGQEVDAVFNVGVRDEVGADKKKPGLAATLLQKAADRRLAITRAEQKEAQERADILAREAQKRADEAARHEAAGRNLKADVAQAQAQATSEAAERAEVESRQDVSIASKTRAGGVTSSVRVKHVCTAIDKVNLDLEAIRLFIDPKALQAAVDAYVKQTGVTTVKGASIEERADGSVRR